MKILLYEIGEDVHVEYKNTEPITKVVNVFINGLINLVTAPKFSRIKLVIALIRAILHPNKIVDHYDQLYFSDINKLEDNNNG